MSNDFQQSYTPTRAAANPKPPPAGTGVVEPEKMTATEVRILSAARAWRAALLAIEAEEWHYKRRPLWEAVNERAQELAAAVDALGPEE
jgi:hypothetical protein